MPRVLSFLMRYFSNYYTLHRSDLAARAEPLDPRLTFYVFKRRWFKTDANRKIERKLFKIPRISHLNFEFGLNRNLLVVLKVVKKILELVI